jgi:hypothetical protein
MAKERANGLYTERRENLIDKLTEEFGEMLRE